MISVQKAIFPGFALGCLFLILITRLITIPGQSLAVVGQNIPAASQSQPARPEPAVSDLPAPALQSEPTTPVLEEQASPPEPDVQVIAPTQEPEPTAQPVVEEPASNPVEEEPAPAECSLNAGYPDSVHQWCGLIERYAGEYGVDPNLVAAVMLQESGGNPDAYSKSGAVGLMQVMPRDGLAAGFMCANGPCFASRPSMNELYDPEFNIDFGVRMLSGLINRHGSVREALRAYGPMNMGYGYADIILGIMSRHQ